MITGRIKRIPFSAIQGKTVVVISDIHSNYDGLSEAIEYVTDKQITEVIILGDLLTYGCQVDAVLTALKELQKSANCHFVLGNHEEFYFDLQSGKKTTSYKLPPFIEESVCHNLELLNTELIEVFDWWEGIQIGRVYLSHANPFGSKNWRYLNEMADCAEAIEVLRKENFQVGIFGHTHRKKQLLFDSKEQQVNHFDGEDFALEQDRCLLVNPGSVGQPRGEGASFMTFELSENQFSFKHIELQSTMENYLKAIESAGLTAATTKKLLSYFGD